jgi:hypothetical protein
MKMANELGGMIAALAGFSVMLFLYFLPTYIAYRRKHKNVGPIAIVNGFFGWTGLGWIGCLAWCLSS